MLIKLAVVAPNKTKGIGAHSAANPRGLDAVVAEALPISDALDTSDVPESSFRAPQVPSKETVKSPEVQPHAFHNCSSIGRCFTG